MRKLLQINITANWGSHGKIAEGIGMVAIKQGWQSFIAYGRWANPSASNLFHIGSRWDEMHHAISSRLFDNHGLMSKKATAELIQYAERIKPDIVHLHNIILPKTTFLWFGLYTTVGPLPGTVPITNIADANNGKRTV